MQSHEVGAGHIAIFPTMKGFRKKVHAGIESTAISGSNVFSRSFNGKKIGTSIGSDFKLAFSKSSLQGDDFLKPLKASVTTSARQAKDALLDYQTASLKAQQAQEKMNDTISKYGADSLQAQQASIAFEKAELRKAAALDKSNTAAEKAQQAQDVLKAAQEELAKTASTLGTRIKNTANNFAQGFSSIGSSSKELTTFSSSLGNLTRSLLGIDTLWKPLGSKINSIGQTALAAVTTWSTQAGTRILTTLQSALATTKGVFSQWGANLRSWVSPAITSVASGWAKLTAPISGVVQNISSRLNSVSSLIGAKVSAMTPPFISKIGGFIGSTLSTVTHGAGRYFNGIKNSMSALWSNLPSGAKSVLTGVSAIASSAVNAVGNAVHTTVSATISGLKGVATGVFGALSAGALAFGGTLLATGKQALSAYAVWEQAVGGVDTLFKSASSTVQGYASQAYKTAGISANAYMSQVTSFAASLVSSLGGDTAKAANLGNMAILDMSDNANKMGTSIDSIQQTYQSLARGNYAMLDNLKLGYGGTKTEMKRLIDDANKLKKATGQVGNLSLEKFSDVVTAIHLVQEKMGITGTTAREAATTIEGSVNSMKASWSNWIAGLGQDNANLAVLSEQLVDSIITVAKNVLPRIVQIARGVITALPSIFTNVITTLPEPFRAMVDMIAHAFEGITQVFKPLKKTIEPLVVAFGALGVQGLAPVLANLPLVGKLFAGLLPPLQFLTGPIGIIIALLAQIVATTPSLSSSLIRVINLVGTSLVNAVQQLMPAFQQLMVGIERMTNAIIPIITQALALLIPQIRPLMDLLISSLVPIVQTVMGVVTRVLVTISSLIRASTPIIIALISSVIDVIKASMPLIELILTITTAVINGIASIITTVLLPVIEQVTSWIINNSATITSVITNVANVFSGIVRLVTALIQGDWQGAWDAFKSIVSNYISGVGTILSTLGSLVQAAVSNAGHWLMDAGGKIVDGLIEGIKSKFSDAFNVVKGLMDGIAKFFPHSPAKKGAFSGRGWTPYSGQAMVSGLAEGITSATPRAVSSIRGAMDSIHSQLNGTGNLLLTNVNSTDQPSHTLSGINLTQNISVPDPLAAGRAGVQMLNMAIA